MDDNTSIIKFFSKMSCSRCLNNFSEESITVLREECNYTVVRVTCGFCGKNIGIAILGLDKNEMKKSLEICDENAQINVCGDCSPIDYDDVIDAHDFFKSLDASWIRHIPENLTE
ncbi:MAG: hypothetical protein WC197_05265 [Candidatus Gastranaerophilaceae bacterium]|jgi:hypothetical protein